MPNTINCMTGATADRFMIKNRGYIKEGYYADLTVFDENKIKNAVSDQTRSFGIEKVFINGNLVLDDGNINSELLKTTGKAIPIE